LSHDYALLEKDLGADTAQLVRKQIAAVVAVAILQLAGNGG
jgi:hypothetical protein